MSVQSAIRRKTAPDIRARKNGEPIVMLTSYHAHTAALVDRISLKRRSDAGAPPIPVGGVGNDLIAVVVGIVAYLALGFVFHPVVIGVPVFGA